MRRNLYDALGGFGERYLGWGAEYTAITVKLQHMTTNQAAPRCSCGMSVVTWQTSAIRTDTNNLCMLQDVAWAAGDALCFQCDLERQFMGNSGKHQLGMPEKSV